MKAVVALFSIASAAPCDIFANGGTPCVAAHSVVRALYDNYAGPLYLLKRSSDSTTKEIDVLQAGGYADSSTQKSFCENTSCTIEQIFDQSPKGNHLTPAPAGGYVHHPDKPVDAARHPIIAGNHFVYGAYFESGNGYRNDKTTGVATGEDPQTMYMVTSGTHFNDGCCFDYGNAETDNNDDGAGTMEAIYFGNNRIWGYGSGSGPWVMADIENGLYGGDQRYNPNSQSLPQPYVTALVKGKQGMFALKGGDAQHGSLNKFHEGSRPAGYETMKKQGAIILGIGGDNSDSAIGTFYEGAMTAGYSSDATDDAVHANIVAAGYGNGPAPPTPPPPPGPAPFTGPWTTLKDQAIACSADEYKGDRGQTSSAEACLDLVKDDTSLNFAVWRGDGNSHCHACAVRQRGANPSSWGFSNLPGATSFARPVPGLEWV